MEGGSSRDATSGYGGDARFEERVRPAGPSIREALERVAGQLRSTEHPVVLIGPPEVGKTTVICTLAGLRRVDGEGSLNDQMALQTGGGRVTICEVHVRNGNDYAISVDPRSVEDLHQFVSEFCEDRLLSLNRSEKSQEGFGISAEAATRALRNWCARNGQLPKPRAGRMISRKAAKNAKKTKSFSFAAFASLRDTPFFSRLLMVAVLPEARAQPRSQPGVLAGIIRIKGQTPCATRSSLSRKQTGDMLPACRHCPAASPLSR